MEGLVAEALPSAYLWTMAAFADLCLVISAIMVISATMPSADPTAMPAMTGAEIELFPRSDVGSDGGGCAGGDGGGDGDKKASGGVGGKRGCATQLVMKISRTVCRSADVARHVRPSTRSVDSPKSNTQYWDGVVWRTEGDESRAAASI